MSYKILLLNPCLYYIKWLEIPRPNSPLMKQYFFELSAILDSEEKPIYMISDLREGHITNVHFLLQLVQILKHKNYGGGCAFSENRKAHQDITMYNMLQSVNRSRNPRDQTELFDNPEDAIAYIEKLKPDVTKGVEWDEVLSGRIFNT